MNKNSRLEIRSILVASVAASVGFCIAFLRSWAIPVRSAIKAKKESENNKGKFLDIYSDEYNNSVYNLSQTTINTYNKYKQLVYMHNKKYEK